MKQAVTLTYEPLGAEQDQSLALIGLDRPEAANAFNGDMLVELKQAFEDVAGQSGCRAALLFGRGKHFSAGADLGWMKESAKLSYDQNVEDARKLTEMFEALLKVPVPTVAALKGAAFGGAVGLVSICDIVVATPGAKLCLSEVKVGLIPAVILPYVARRLPYGALRRYGLSGQVIPADTAAHLGLVDRVSKDDADFATAVRDELNAILAAGPAAQRSLKRLLSKLQDDGFRQSDATAEAIAATRTSAEGQAGLQAFFDKSKAPWILKLADNWKWE